MKILLFILSLIATIPLSFAIEKDGSSASSLFQQLKPIIDIFNEYPQKMAHEPLFKESIEKLVNGMNYQQLEAFIRYIRKLYSQYTPIYRYLNYQLKNKKPVDLDDKPMPTVESMLLPERADTESLRKTSTKSIIKTIQERIARYLTNCSTFCLCLTLDSCLLS